MFSAKVKNQYGTLTFGKINTVKVTSVEFDAEFTSKAGNVMPRLLFNLDCDGPIQHSLFELNKVFYNEDGEQKETTEVSDPAWQKEWNTYMGFLEKVSKSVGVTDEDYNAFAEGEYGSQADLFSGYAEMMNDFIETQDEFPTFDMSPLYSWKMKSGQTRKFAGFGKPKWQTAIISATITSDSDFKLVTPSDYDEDATEIELEGNTISIPKDSKGKPVGFFVNAEGSLHPIQLNSWLVTSAYADSGIKLEETDESW